MGPSLILPILLPLLIATLVLFPASRATGLRLAPWMPLPGLILALAAPADLHLDLPGVLLGTHLGLDESGRLFLLFTALVWLLAGWFAHGWLRDDAGKHRFWTFFLIAQAGNLGVCLAQDAASFYLLFALMSFSAYGLVVHSGAAEALRAGRVYLAMAVLGEALLVAGMLLAVGAAGSHRLADLAAVPLSGPAAVLLIAGFGIKVGVPLLHMWLPLAHPVAPVPASAALSGVMLKAGLLGWLRFLPLGAQALPEAGATLMLAGFIAMFLGVIAGLMQRNLKVLLAYSSVSQMGYLSLGVGAGLLSPAAWPLLLPALGFYALHHALAKSALFLGAGLIRTHGANTQRRAALAVPALALAGAPLTSGVLAKDGLKQALVALPGPWPDLVAGLLPFAALGTALLMARLIWLAWRLPTPDNAAATPRGLHAPWLLAVLASAMLPWVLASDEARIHAFEFATLAAATWPLLAAAALSTVAVFMRLRAPALPPGDLLHPLAHGIERLRGARPRWGFPETPDRSARMHVAPRTIGEVMTTRRTGALWLALLAAFTLLLAR
ncbi:MAG: proton-conducting transporter membrane subunit [Thiobacillus sp.]|nr:proton-conducting transporter membrane subunit [Thiobacillus sp.]